MDLEPQCEMHFAIISGGKSGSNCPRAMALPVVFLISAAMSGGGGNVQQYKKLSPKVPGSCGFAEQGG